MMNSSEITVRLPPRREDEPATLRQDIVDEILDHLKCGMRRELLLHGGDEVSAYEFVLRKFGDPREIARKLWFQAMWSQIMSQRLVFGSALFSMAACTALVGMMGWMMQQQTQQANAAMQLQQQASVAMLEHLSKLVPQRTESQPQRDLRWNLLQVRATIGGLDGPAAEKCSVNVSKLPTLGQVMTATGSFSGQIGPSGLVECGYAEPGRYQANV